MIEHVGLRSLEFTPKREESITCEQAAEKNRGRWQSVPMFCVFTWSVGALLQVLLNLEPQERRTIGGIWARHR